MTTYQRYVFTRDDCQRGGRTRKHRATLRTPAFIRGYQAGWVAAKRGQRKARRRSAMIVLEAEP